MMMNRPHQTEAQRRQFEERLQHLIDLENFKRAAEADAQREQEQLKEQIAALSAQEQAELLSLSAQHYQAFLDSNRKAMEAVFQALDAFAGQLAAFKVEWNDIDTTHKSAEQFAENAIARYVSTVGNMPHLGKDHSRLSFEEQAELDDWRTRYAQAAGRAESAFKPTLPAWAAYNLWVSTAPTQENRELRARLVYLLTGQEIDVTPGYDPYADVQRAKRQQRRGY